MGSTNDCILNSKKGNGIADCVDGSDEPNEGRLVSAELFYSLYTRLNMIKTLAIN